MIETAALQILLEKWLASFLLIFARLIGFISQAPVFSELSIPALVKVGFALAFGVILSHLVETPSYPDLQTNFYFALVINVLVGVMVGYLIKLVTYIIETAGEFIDLQLGLNFASIINPGVGQETLLQKFYRNFGLVIFATSGGMEIALTMFLKSFHLFGLTSTNFAQFNLDPIQIVTMTGNVISLAIIAAAPVILVIVFMDIVLGLMSRAAPQINPFNLSYSLKPPVGLIVILLTLPFFQTRVLKIILEGAVIFK
ncbi:MAG: flagellar biosynthetic protein FliR [Candidatus Caenarcaniphilales bacterium]|nr:flagellar biosynthetic protein FliR [Candidatus Caenarcaniphilales bacterium]